MSTLTTATDPGAAVRPTPTQAPARIPLRPDHRGRAAQDVRHPLRASG